MNWTEKFYSAIFRELKSNREGIHITALTYDCLRRAYYDLTTDSPIELKGGIRMWIGKKAHETKLSSHHELRLEWSDIRGTVDEYEDGYFVDKKTTRNIPNRPREHHAKQLNMYRVLLEKNGFEVKGAAILYIDVNTADVVEFPIKLVKDIGEVEKEMVDKKIKLETALERGWLPDRHIDWLCHYCNHASRCFTEEGLQDPRRVEVTTE